jgi:hypothetical protein
MGKPGFPIPLLEGYALFLALEGTKKRGASQAVMRALPLVFP